MLFLDTETCGLTGPIVLIQWADNDDSVTLYEVWKNPVDKTLDRLRNFSERSVCAFNLSFDWFHINKLYNLFILVRDKSELPNPIEIAEISTRQPNEYCLKPKNCLDLMLVARQGPWQTLMDRDDVKIRRVPMEMARPLANYLRANLDIPDIYFKKKEYGYEWKVETIDDDPTFCDVVLRFAPSSGLKPLCEEIFKIPTTDFPVPKEYWPEKEPQYDPYNIKWLSVISYHINFWSTNKTARGYAEQDVILLQRLWHHFGEPKPGDNDSVLAGCVGASRWRGFEVSIPKCCARIKELKKISIPINVNAHADVKRWLKEVATENENILIVDTTKTTLEALAKWDTEAGHRAQQVINVRRAQKELNLLDKLVEVGRFCPEFKIIGTKSGRMSGGGTDEVRIGRKGGSINPQGIPRVNEIRELFTLKQDNYRLSGGDFDSFEVVLADAAYNDSNLRNDLQAGKKFHALFGSILYRLPYEQILSSKGTDRDLYSPSKTSAFALLYGAQAKRLATTAQVDEQDAEQVYKDFTDKYPGVGEARKTVFDMFCSVRQPRGLGTAVEWHEPADFVESLLGFRRYFTLENNIVRTLFELAQNPPDSFDIVGKCFRRKKEQTLKGAAQSAIYGTVFQVQARNMRAAANHVIQSTGAEITKMVQKKIWDKQPYGVNKWVVQPFNLHDEIMCVHDTILTAEIRWIVEQTVEAYRALIPLIKMEWQVDLDDWGDK